MYATKIKNNTVNHPRKSEDTSGKNAKGKDINLQKRDGAYKGTKRIEWSKFCCCLNYLKLFAFLYRKDIPEACFYNTLNLSKMKKEESVVGNVANKADSGAHVGNKILPITEDATETKDQTKEDKKKPNANMKELNRWAASAKTEKGRKLNGRKVSMLRRRGTPKEVPSDDQVYNDAPKISFMEICTTINSSACSVVTIASSSAKNIQTQIAHSTTSIPPATKTSRLANIVETWITTDEYVVLEL